MMRIGYCAVMLALGMAGCAQSGGDEESARIPEGAVSQTADPASATGSLVPDTAIGPDAADVVSNGANVRFDPTCLITAASAAGIAMPDTLGDFVSAFPAGTVLSFYPTYIVDFGKLCIRANSEDALCADFESYEVEDYSPDIPVAGLSIYAPQCRTVEGVGPGTPLSEAVEAYGAPTLSFNYDNEGREYVSFAHGPDTLNFRAQSATGEADESTPNRPNGNYAGNYEGVTGDGYFETREYYLDGQIREVWIAPPVRAGE